MASIQILEITNVQKQTEALVERIEKIIGLEIPASEKCRLYSMAEVEDVRFVIKPDLVKNLRFFVVNKTHLEFMQDGKIYKSLKDLDYHKSFWAYDRHTNREGMRELFFRKKVSRKLQLGNKSTYNLN